MPEQFESKYFRGRGALFISDRAADGSPVGFDFLGDMTTVEMTPDVQLNDVLENVSGMDAVGASWLSRVAYNVAINMRSVKPTHFQHGTHGSATAHSASPATDEPHVASHDRLLALNFLGVSNVVVTNDAGAVTYTVDTDYIVHAENGLIEILSTGTITDGQDLLIDYDYVAQSSVTAAPHNVAKYLMFSGINTADNDKRVRVEIYKVKLSPTSISMITEGNADGPVTGVVEQDTLRSTGDQLYKWKAAA